MTTPDPMYMLRGCSQPITALLTVSQSKLVAGVQNGGLFVWNLKTRRIIQYINAHSESVLSVRSLAGLILSQGRDGFIRKWKWKEDDTLELIGEIVYESVGFFPVVTTDFHLYTASSKSPGQITRLNIDGISTADFIVNDPNERKYGMAMIAKLRDEKIFIGYEDGSIIVWNTENFTLISRKKLHNESIMALDVSHNTARGVSASVDTTIHLWSWNDDFEIERLKSVEITNPGVNSVAIRPDDKLFVCACWDETVRVYSMKKMTLLAILKAHKGAIRCLCFDDDDLLYVGSDDAMISVWGIYRT